mgnify:CR=1 FL=1
MPDFSQLFCNFGANSVHGAQENINFLKIYGDDRTAETSHYRKWKAIFPLYYHTQSFEESEQASSEQF